MQPFVKAIHARGILSFAPDSEPLALTPLNVLIGPNASGKSNLVEIFELLKALPTACSLPWQPLLARRDAIYKSIQILPCKPRRFVASSNKMSSMGKLAACAAMLTLVASAATRLEFDLRDADGGMHTQAEWTSARAVVLFYVTTDCPLSNAYAPEMDRIEEAYTPRGVRFYAVQGDSTIAPGDVRQHARDFAYRFPVLLDPEQMLAQHTGATVTPEAVVLSHDGAVLYLGRIDNRVEDFGKVRIQATEFDLRDALDAILSGQPVPHPHTRALGCAITTGH